MALCNRCTIHLCFMLYAPYCREEKFSETQRFRGHKKSAGVLIGAPVLRFRLTAHRQCICSESRKRSFRWIYCASWSRCPTAPNFKSQSLEGVLSETELPVFSILRNTASSARGSRKTAKRPRRECSRNLTLNAAQISVKSVCHAPKPAQHNVTLRLVLDRTSPPGDSPGILIVEDDAVILETLAYNLIRQGFIAYKASDGVEALKLTRKLRPDLILLDLMLPGHYDGIQVCKKIRRDDLNVVIIMITAKDAEEDKVKGFEAGADDYVTKPFGMKELAARINANSSGARSPGEHTAGSSRSVSCGSTRRTSPH